MKIHISIYIHTQYIHKHQEATRHEDSQASRRAIVTTLARCLGLLPTPKCHYVYTHTQVPLLLYVYIHINTHTHIQLAWQLGVGKRQRECDSLGLLCGSVTIPARWCGVRQTCKNVWQSDSFFARVHIYIYTYMYV